MNDDKSVKNCWLSVNTITRVKGFHKFKNSFWSCFIMSIGRLRLKMSKFVGVGPEIGTKRGKGKVLGEILQISSSYCQSCWVLWIISFKKKKNDRILESTVWMRNELLDHVQNEEFFFDKSNNFRPIFAIVFDRKWKVRKTVKQWCEFQCLNKMASDRHFGFL